MFFHGFENYLKYAFPEDELRALTCGPLVRDEKNPENNDVLGNYSLTLIDSLSTLAILSSSPDSGERALAHFQDGVEGFVRLYGDGSDGPAGQGERSRGFDLDSKVQLFETVIRGLGMLSSPSCLIDLSLLDFRLLCPTANVSQVDYSVPIFSPSASYPSPVTSHQNGKLPSPVHGIKVCL
jgi:hypothetical protein